MSGQILSYKDKATTTDRSSQEYSQIVKSERAAQRRLMHKHRARARKRQELFNAIVLIGKGACIGACLVIGCWAVAHAIAG